MDGTLNDLRFAWRSLRRAPGFALGVVAVLALGIGANAAMFTVLRATLFQRMAFRKPSELVSLVTAPLGDPMRYVQLADIGAWRERTHTLQAISYFSPDLVTLMTSAAQQEISDVRASANLFDTLGAAPMLGRAFTPAEQQPGHDKVVVLSEAVWRTQFGADPGVLGRTVRLNDDLVSVIGVMPRAFSFPLREDGYAQVWQPAALTQDDLTRGPLPMKRTYEVIARRNPGSSVADVTRELTAVQRSLEPLYSAYDPAQVPTHVLATALRQTLAARQRKALFALAAAVGLLWLIACADVISLNLARTASRRRELAVRLSLGATRWHLVRQMLVESLLLCIAGGAAGLLLATGVLAVLQHQLAQMFGEGLALHVDGAVLLSLFAMSLCSAVLCGAMPALLAARHAPEPALRSDGAQAGAGRHQQRLQRVLVVSELALTLCLLIGCGLLVRTVLALRQVPLGFRTDHIVSINPKLPFYKYSKLDPNTLVYQPLAARLRVLPGVQSVAVTSVAPLTGHFDVTFMLKLQDAVGQSRESYLSAKLRAAGPELQHVLGFRMVRGRFFDPALDTPTTQPVAVVNRAFATLYAPHGDVTKFQFGGSGERRLRIVGIVDDFHQQGIAEAPAPEIDVNAAQMRPTDGFYQPTLKAHAEILLRSARDPADLLPEIRRVLVGINPDLAGAQIETMDQIVEDAMGSQLLAAHLLEVLGGLALLVALTGLYSLLAYLVTLRTRELGVRLALGAQRGDILAMVLRGAGGLLLLGIALGLLLSLLSAHLLTRFLFGVRAFDPTTFAGAAIALLAVGSLAAALPAHHAAAIEPTEALRAE